ncbi:hypothetical protein MLD38_025329 [Melastoma candidum]|uniref:Uncharacterized protein n=1 Tax=Melastoma candidum TaxID=119954 RepID=A0ACB9NVZ8_9MYRT|nr:hypothetical protein MLD38_025329 [Melastoma candidum]
MGELTEKHKLLIQALISRGPLSEEEAISMVLSGRSQGTRDQLFKEYLSRINEELSFVQCEVRACRDQYDGNVYYGFVNKVSDDHSQLGTTYSVPQIALYKAVMEAILQDGAAQGCISNIDALNICLDSQNLTGSSQSEGTSVLVPAALKNFTLLQKDKTLEDLTRDRWLCLTPDGNIGLGVRSFLDLRTWFSNSGVPSCELCSEAAIKAVLCPNENCSVRLHEYCLKKRSLQKRIEKVCPGCGTPWSSTAPKSELVDEDKEPVHPVKTEQASGSRRKKLRNSANGQAATQHPSSSQSQEPKQQPEHRKAIRRSARLRQ